MAPGDRQPSSRIIERFIPSLDAGKAETMAEGPSGIAQRQSKLQAIQLELRALFPSIQRNTMFNPITGGEEAKFLFKLVGSFCASRTVLFGDSEITILSTEQSMYIEPPHLVDGKRLRPLYVQHFIYGEISPETLSQDSRLSPEIHDEYSITFSQGEGKRQKYLFPAEPKIMNVLNRISVPPAANVVDPGPASAVELDLSAMAVYLPKDIDEARLILLKSSPAYENMLDLIKIHDTLESTTQVLFSGDEKKTSIPYSVLQVSGGIKYHLYPYGVSPPMGQIPQGCALLAFQRSEDQKVHYLLLPESRIPALIARGLPPQNNEERVG